MLDFIHAEGLKGSQRPVLQSPTHHILHGMADLLPGGVKGFRRLFPGELARPVRLELHVHLGQLTLAARPRHFLDDNAAGPAIHPPHRIEQEHQKAPQRDEFELPLREMVIAWGRLMAAGANGCRALAGSDPDFDRGPVRGAEARALVDKSPKMMTLV